jgi:hypothetical protein
MPTATVVPTLGESAAEAAAANVLSAVQQITTLVLTLATTGMTLVGVWIGWQFMKAEDDGKRKEAKTKLIYLFVGLIALTLVNTIAGQVLNGMVTNAQNELKTN